MSKGVFLVVIASTALEIGTTTADDFKQYFNGEIQEIELMDRFTLQVGKAAGKGIAT